MKFLDLKKHINHNIFSILELSKIFPKEKKTSLRMQISRFVEKGLITQIKRALYCFDPNLIDEFQLTNYLYAPSYISLESALNYYGLIPDVPQAVTSINLITTKTIKNQFGRFYYHKIKKSLFWGYTKIKLPKQIDFFLIAQKEKALLDFFYIRKIKQINELRLDFSEFDFSRYKNYSKHFPEWVQEISLKQNL